jgi:signal transduction histidine kinase
MKSNSSFKLTDLSCLLPSDTGLEGLIRDEVNLHKIEEHFKQLIQNQQNLISNIRKIHAMLSREGNEINFINLYDLIERVIHMLEKVDHLKNIDAVVYNEGKDSFYGNELMLFCMITGIVKNSIEYRAVGQLKHWIRVVINDTNHGKQITFFDNGRGVKKELQEEVFYLTKQSVLQLGGSLEISSDTNAGTVIICRIPSKKE